MMTSSPPPSRVNTLEKKHVSFDETLITFTLQRSELFDAEKWSLLIKTSILFLQTGEFHFTLLKNLTLSTFYRPRVWTETVSSLKKRFCDRNSVLMITRFKEFHCSIRLIRCPLTQKLHKSFRFLDTLWIPVIKFKKYFLVKCSSLLATASKKSFKKSCLLMYYNSFYYYVYYT